MRENDQEAQFVPFSIPELGIYDQGMAQFSPKDGCGGFFIARIRKVLL